MNISVLGCGRWGSFIAWYLQMIGHNIILWGRSGSERLKNLVETGKNDILTLGENIFLTDNIKKSVSESEILIISINAQNLRDLMERISQYDLKKKIIVLCMKGIEDKTGKRLTEVTSEYILSDTGIAIWVGPGHVQSFVQGIPNCMVIDSNDDEVKKLLVKEFTSKLIRFYYGNDIIGNEIGAAAKNVMGIAAGALDGLGLESLKGSLMSRGALEVSRLIGAMGGNAMSAYGLSHLGDYEATLFSSNSNNRQFGLSLAKGEKYTKLAEGVSTVKAMLLLGQKYNIDLPICKAVNDFIQGDITPRQAVTKLFLRSVKNEFYT